LVVRDHNGQQLAYVYFEDEPGRQPKLLIRDQARRIAAYREADRVVAQSSHDADAAFGGVRLGIARGQWQVAIYFQDNGVPEERTVIGTRQDGRSCCSDMISAIDERRLRLLR
jgi:hypothetical protein